MPACEMKRSGIERAHCVRQEGADARVRDEAKRNRASALRKAGRGGCPRERWSEAESSIALRKNKRAVGSTDFLPIL